MVKDSTPLILTEGEKKSASACKHGYPTIGLGGVWCWKSKDLGIDFLPELNAFNWNRDVIIAFDSDSRENKDIRKATKALCDQLTIRGARVSRLDLPPEGDAKVGLDDYLVAHGTEALDQLILEATPLTMREEELAEYAERYVLVVGSAAVWDTHMRSFQSVSKFRQSHPHDFVSTYDTYGRVVKQTKADAWLEYPGKKEVHSISCDPSAMPGEMITVQIARQDVACVNSFRGYATEPKRGTVKPWLDLLDIIFYRNKEEARWFEQWLAFPLQHPGQKAFQAVFVYGGQHIGKSAIGLIMLDIYGTELSGKQVQDHAIFSNFNKWLEGTIFVNGDDLEGDAPRKSRAAIKSLVGGETVSIEPKGVDAYQSRNLSHFYMSANEMRSLPLDPGGSNRRFMVIDGPQRPPKPGAWYREHIGKWRKNGGPSHLMYRLMHQIDLVGFDPYDNAPNTPAKSTVAKASQSNIEEWVSRMDENPSLVHDLYTANELFKVYSADTQAGPRASVGAFTNALGQFAYSCHQIWLGEHSPDKRKRASLWAIRDEKKYARMKDEQLAKCYGEQRVETEPKGAKK